MRKAKDIKKIKCPIFKSKNKEIEKINKAINEAREIGGKAHLAERLIKEADGLLACKLFDEKKPECKICHYIADLRKRMANLVLKASPR